MRALKAGDEKGGGSAMQQSTHKVSRFMHQQFQFLKKGRISLLVLVHRSVYNKYGA